MAHIEFTPESIKTLRYERYHHPHPRVQIKMEALLLKSKGLLHGEICRITEISRSSLQRYLKDYAEGGIESLKEIKFYQPKSSLLAYQSTLEEYFRQHPPSTVLLTSHFFVSREDFSSSS